MLIGLTGSLGSGKSTVRALFEKHGMRTIDCDALVKDILHDDASMKALLIERWGDAVLDVSGEVNRNAIAQKVFKDAASLAWLESELHPRVRKHWTAAVTAEPIYDWLIEVPLLFEKNLETLFDYTLCVACSLNVQQRRLVEAGVCLEDARRRMVYQLPAEDKMSRADFVLLNDGSKAFLTQQVDQLFRQLKQLKRT
ncbi:MAG TPA: dephospho-CoA kinase [Opitutae bacterium]|nr:dephospho-CoA kinase [Opitutae bacterium]|tara:strand:- start:131 stop:721 length:591 start_codon:yes stop_codon:yes gene_type:complete